MREIKEAGISVVYSSTVVDGTTTHYCDSDCPFFKYEPDRYFGPVRCSLFGVLHVDISDLDTRGVPLVAGPCKNEIIAKCGVDPKIDTVSNLNPTNLD